MPVKVVKIRNDYRNRKCDRQNAGDDAQRSDELAPDAERRDVAVADRRHGDDRPPEPAGYRRDLRSRLARLGVISGRAEDHHRDE